MGFSFLSKTVTVEVWGFYRKKINPNALSSSLPQSTLHTGFLKICVAYLCVYTCTEWGCRISSVPEIKTYLIWI